MLHVPTVRLLALRLRLPPLVRRPALCTPHALDVYRTFRPLFSPLDGLFLRVEKSACSFCIGSLGRIIAIVPALYEEGVLVFCHVVQAFLDQLQVHASILNLIAYFKRLC